MSIDTEALRARTDIVAVIRAYTALKKVGAEYVGACPIHGGDGGNFYVNPNKRIWACFSHSCHECEEGNDVIGFLRLVENLSFKEACEKLGATDSWKPVAPVAELAPKRRAERKCSKPHADAGEPDMELRSLGKPARVWTYRDTDGAPLMYVARYETPEGKEIRCFCWAEAEGETPRWHCTHYTRGERPLYNLHRIAASPADTQIVVVEGEKAADAAQERLPQLVVTTWPGGAGAWKHASYEPLRGRSVVLWPDADEGGREAMTKLAGVIAAERGLACKVKIIDTADLPDGFDAADWEGENLLAWLKPRARPFLNPVPPVVPATPSPGASDPLPEPAGTGPAPKPQRSKPHLAAVDGTAALAPQTEPEALPAAMSEDALATQFAEAHSPRWRYVKAWSAWFEWRGDGWHRDETALIDRLAVELTRQALYWPEAMSLTPDGKRKVNSKRTAGNVRDLALSDRRIAATVDQWDRDPWLLGVPGGVVDLKTGKLHDARPDQYITKRCAVAPEDGEAPNWRALLDRVTQGDASLLEYLQRLCGYILTGETREECFAFVYGPAQTGKSTFVRVLQEIMGDYHRKASMETFTETRHERHAEELAVLAGARLVTAVETEEGRRWNESRIKALTGRDRIRARFMRENSFEFDPQFKLLIAGNHAPHLRNVDDAMKRRLHIIPFTHHIPMSERDDQLADKLRAEYPQILAWMVRGALEWQAYKLGRPEQVSQAVDDYLQYEDTLGEWLAEAATRDNEGRCQTSSAYTNYKAWAESSGEFVMSQKRFVQALKERGFDTKRPGGTRYIYGFSLKSNDTPKGYYGE